MKILFVFTGGTVGSTLEGEFISPDSKKSRVLLDAYSQRYGIDFEYDTVEPYSALSENNTGTELKSIISTLSKAHGYDGTVIAHGTDTLQYTAAALGYCFGNDCAPICIVSSNYPIEDERANGLYNLYGAISLIRSRQARGVFVAYKNSCDNKISIHRATRLLAHNAFEDSLFSAKGAEFGFVEDRGGFYKNPLFVEKIDETEAPDVTNLLPGASNILRLNSHVGMNYPKLSENVKYILIESYHSGTINVRNEEALAFFNDAKRLKIKVFMSGVMNGARYASAESFEELSVIPIKNIAPIALYIKLWLYSLSCDVDEFLLLKSRGGDIC